MRPAYRDVELVQSRPRLVQREPAHGSQQQQLQPIVLNRPLGLSLSQSVSLSLYTLAADMALPDMDISPVPRSREENQER